MKLDKTNTLLTISGIVWFVSLCVLINSICKHNDILKATQKNHALIKNQLGAELIEATKYDAIIKDLESHTGTQYYNLINYLKNQGATISDEKARNIPDTSLNAYSFTASLNNCSIDNLYKIIYHAEQELGIPRFRVAGIELQTQSSSISASSSTQTPISAKIIFETIIKR